MQQPDPFKSVENKSVWEQPQGESAKWFERFSRYRLMGASRSLVACYREEAARLSPEKPSSARSLPGSWRNAFKKWQWQERCKAWDVEQAKLHEDVLAAARSRQVESQIELEDELLEREIKLRSKAYEWVEDYLFGRVIEVRTTEKERTGADGTTHEKITVSCPQFPPQWMLERFIGKRDYEKQFGVLMDLLKKIMAIEGNSDDLQQVKSLIQASLEGLLLESGVDEVRTLLLS